MNLKGRKDRQAPDPKEVEAVTSELADKTYGAPVDEPKSSEMRRTTIYIPEDLQVEAEDLAYANKRAKKTPKSFSAVVVDALKLYLLQQRKGE